MNEVFMVYVSCMTYNHSAYIKDALDGFCMQQTSFPYVCGIIDDASTDGEPEVIRNYLDEHFDLSDAGVVRRDETDDFVRIFARHKENKNCFFAVVFLKYNHYRNRKNKSPYIAEWRDNARYVALCEGDDFWTEKEKLQRQYDFMESHPYHSLCFCSHYELFPNGDINEIHRYPTLTEECPIKDIIHEGGGYMSTNSMFYRNSLYVSYDKWAPGCPIGDLPLMLSLAVSGHVGYLPELMCVYRKFSNSSWTIRVALDIKARRKHYRAIQNMWRQFDLWTNKEYHWTVFSKQVRNAISQFKREMKSIVRNKK